MKSASVMTSLGYFIFFSIAFWKSTIAIYSLSVSSQMSIMPLSTSEGSCSALAQEALRTGRTGYRYVAELPVSSDILVLTSQKHAAYLQSRPLIA